MTQVFHLFIYLFTVVRSETVIPTSLLSVKTYLQKKNALCLIFKYIVILNFAVNMTIMDFFIILYYV